MSGNVLLRQAQYRKAGEAAFALSIAAACVAGKIRNGRQVLLRGAREAKSAEDAARLTRAADDLAASLRAVPGAADLDALRGVEGDAARKYFDGLGLLIRADLRDSFPMDLRSRRPPRDRLNALLSFIYSMWMNDCRSACEAAGLDPQVGFLHALRPGRAAPGGTGTMSPFVIGLAGGSMRSAAKTTTPQKGSHLARMRSLGLVGCIKDGPRDLAQNHKKYLRLALRAKYRPR